MLPTLKSINKVCLWGIRWCSSLAFAWVLTVMGKELLEGADLVIYAGSLVNPEVLNYSNGEKIDSYGLTLDETNKLIVDNLEAGKKVVRLHSKHISILLPHCVEHIIVCQHGEFQDLCICIGCYEIGCKPTGNIYLISIFQGLNSLQRQKFRITGSKSYSDKHF